MIRLFAAVLSPNTPLFHSVPTKWRYTASGPPETEMYSTSPGPDLPTDATPEHVPFWEGPTPEERTPRVFDKPSRCKGSAHTLPEGRDCGPPPEEHPPDDNAKFRVPAP